MYTTVTEEGCKVTVHVIKNNLTASRAYYSRAAEPKRTCITAYIAQITKGKGLFVYLDAFCASGITGIRLQSLLQSRIHVQYNDKMTVPGIIRHNCLLNGVIPSSITSVPVDKLIITPRTILEIDPYGSPLPYLSAQNIRNAKPAHLILTHTDLINLCSRRGLTHYYRKHNVVMVYTKIYNELALRTSAYLVYNLSKIPYLLNAYYSGSKYLTLFLVRTTRPETYGMIYICVCGASYATYMTCKVCFQPTVLIGPLLKSTFVLGEVGGFNVGEYSRVRQLSLKYSVFEAHLSSADVIFKRCKLGPIYKINKSIEFIIDVLDKVYR